MQPRLLRLTHTSNTVLMRAHLPLYHFRSMSFFLSISCSTLGPFSHKLSSFPSSTTTCIYGARLLWSSYINSMFSTCEFVVNCMVSTTFIQYPMMLFKAIFVSYHQHTTLANLDCYILAVFSSMAPQNFWELSPLVCIRTFLTTIRTPGLLLFTKILSGSPLAAPSSSHLRSSPC